MNNPPFVASTYSSRRGALASKLNKGLVVFTGNNESPMNYPDNWYGFRQDSSFLYYFGIDRPNFAAVLDVDSGESFLFGDDFSVADIVWMGPQPSVQDLCALVEIPEYRSRGSLSAVVKQARALGRPVHFLAQYRHDLMIELAESFSLPVATLNDHASLELTRAVIDQRSIKTEEEIVEIEKAMEVAYHMHTTAMREMKSGIIENEIVGKIEGVARGMGKNPSFPIIFSIHGETLHNHYHGNMMRNGDIVVCDAGAEVFSNYASDVTRTIPVSGKFSESQKAIYEIVLRALNEAIEACKPGVAYHDVHLGAARVITQGLQDLDLMKGDIDASIAAGAHALFFPHGLGHMMGLDVHDMEGLGEDLVGYNDEFHRSEQFGLRYLRLGRKLEAGFVITVEPGIYFIPALIDEWESTGEMNEFINFGKVNAMKGFGGIRIEDDILITDSGSRVLGPAIPKEVEEVENLVGVSK